MIKKIACLLAVALVLASCKNDAASKINTNSVETPPASPNDILDPEPNIGGPEVKTEQVAPPANGKYPIMAFADQEHDFGTISEGDKVSYNFEFKNTGEADLIISQAKGSCGCTVPEFPKEPVKPGESGKIKVTFNSAGKPGDQHKSVTITANTANATERLSITASVKPKNTAGITNFN